MALTYGFYDAELKDGEYDRTYNAADFSSYLDGIISDGVLKNYGDAFECIGTGSNTMVLKTGKAWLNGTWTKVDEDKEISVPASPKNQLYGLILTVNKTARRNTISLKAFDQKITVDSDDKSGIYEYCLAGVRVTGGRFIPNK